MLRHCSTVLDHHLIMNFGIRLSSKRQWQRLPDLDRLSVETGQEHLTGSQVSADWVLHFYSIICRAEGLQAKQRLEV